MNRHLAFASWLHIVAAVFVLGCVAVIWIAASQLASTFDGTFIPGLVALFGKPVAVALIVLALIQSISATALLLGARGIARLGLGLISALLLPVFPIGTTLGVYTFFALSQPIVAREVHYPEASSAKLIS